MAELRSVICSVLGHVDHGKTSLLDRIRNTTIANTEPGLITQAIGVSIAPIETIKKVCGSLLGAIKKLTIPGLLFIDTPGHAAFSSLRKRGGALADIAVLVVDINEGFKPQTIESIEILKQAKTPFIVAANKIDLLNGWRSNPKESLLKNIEGQNPDATGAIETQLYRLVARFNDLGFNADRFDRVEDYTKQIAIVPVSAKTGEGIPELLMVLVGLAQKYLEEQLKVHVEGAAKGSILEVKETKGFGVTVDAVIYDGTLKKGNTIVIGGLEKPIVTKVKALLQPEPLSEMRDKKAKFKQVDKAVAATGVKISAPELEGALAGMPLVVCEDNLEECKQEVQSQIEEVTFETDKIGVIVKADTLGSLEAMIKLLHDKGIQIKRASLGNITKKDLMDAETNKEEDELQAVILAFNVEEMPEIKDQQTIKIIKNKIIYKIIEDYELWLQEEQKKRQDVLYGVTRPCKVQLMKGYVFRQKSPAVVGTEILGGILKPGMKVMNEKGKEIGVVRQIQHEQENIPEAKYGQQVAVSYEGPTVGRQIKEGDILYSIIIESEFRKMKDHKENLTPKEIELLKEIAQIMRKTNPAWGI
ncbi:MAG: translation initiation factor IF-2 [Candidatus Woesearchaeota archaeon]